MAGAGAGEIGRLYQCAERISAATNKSDVVDEFQTIMIIVKSGSTQAKQLSGQLIPRFLKYFPDHVIAAMNTMFDLIEDSELAVRVQAIRGLSLVCKDNSTYVPKIIDVLVQLLTCEDIVERDAVHKGLLSLLRLDKKAALTALFKNVANEDESIREKVICYLRDKVFPIKAELLKPRDEMESHITSLVKRLQDLTGNEFKLFVDFLKTFRKYGKNSPPEQDQELIEIIEGQADLNAQFDVTDIDHIDRLITCMYMALPLFKKGVSSSNLLNYMNYHIIPAFAKFPEERKLDLLKNLAGCSPYATSHDARQILPTIVQLLKEFMPQRKTEEANIDFVECLLFAFHHLSNKTPNSTNSLCGYRIVTGQPSDRLGEDFSENNKDFMQRLSAMEEIVNAAMKSLTQRMTEQNKAMFTAMTEEEKAIINEDRQKTLRQLRMCKNIQALAQPLHLIAPSFIGDDTINLSWLPGKPPLCSAVSGDKRTAPANYNLGTDVPLHKRGRGDGGVQQPLASKHTAGLNRGSVQQSLASKHTAEFNGSGMQQPLAREHTAGLNGGVQQPLANRLSAGLDQGVTQQFLANRATSSFNQGGNRGFAGSNQRGNNWRGRGRGNRGRGRCSW